jgi:hypothetical protein
MVQSITEAYPEEIATELYQIGHGFVFFLTFSVAKPLK